jgi:exopolysaccharide production protein ExoQ
MNPTVAFLIFSVGVAGLFFLNRDSSVRTSAALWLPVTWLWIVGSRPVSSWFGMDASATSVLDATLNGSPLDAAIFAALLCVGLVVLFFRKKKTGAYLALSGPILVYFLYCLASVAWSPFPEPSFKRWTKAVGDLVMVLVILTDTHPVVALRRLYTRVGFILFPFSVCMIRYGATGRGFDSDGTPSNVGLTTNKNELGLIVFVISLGLLWNVRWLLSHKNEPNRGRRLIAQLTGLGFGIYLLQQAHSATSVLCFVLGAGLMYATSFNFIKRRPGRVLAFSLGVVLIGALGLFFGAGSAVSQSLGRGGGLSGRTDIWACSISVAGSAAVGSGFESFWNAKAGAVNHCLTLRGFRDLANLNSAHNGYLQIYLDLGTIGVFLIVLILINGFRYASRAFEFEPEMAGLLLACITTVTFYNASEAGFRILTPSWISLVLGVIGSAGITAGLIRDRIVPPKATNQGESKSAPQRLPLRPVRRERRLNDVSRANRIAIDTLPA